MSNVSSKQAGSYYEKDGYYARLDVADNRWGGSLKEQLGLPDNVKKEEFDLLIKENKARAGIDLCFSAPKSVSVAMCLDDKTRADMIDAHNIAVEKAMKEIESREIGTRITKDGVTTHVKTGNMVYAKFNHYVSRNSDPQLHSHNVILNYTMHNGKMYAIDNPDLYKNQMLYGQIYRNELAKNLLEKGYEIERTDLAKGFFELKGIEAQTLEKFSSRRQEIEAQLKEWGVNTPAAAERAALSTRAAKEHRNLNELTQSWRETIHEIGGVKIEKADHAITRTDEQKAQEIEEGIKRIATQEYAFSDKTLKRAVLAAGVASGLTEAEYDKYVKEHPEQIINIGKRLDQANGPDYYTTRANMEQEARIMEIAQNGRGAMPGMTPERADELVRQFDAKGTLDKDSGQQGAAVRQMLASNDRVFALQGLAGTGKTYALDYARQAWEAEGYVVKGGAFQGRAASGLEADSGIGSSTLHKLLNQMEKEAGNQSAPKSLDGPDEIKNSWDLRGLKPGPQREVWVIDEAGMVNNALISQVMEAAEKRDAKLILVGDDKQLPPIGAGNAFADLVQLDRIDYCLINEIRRQKEQSEREIVKEIVQGDINKAIEQIKIVEIPKKSARMKAMVGEYMGAEREKTIILTADNKARTHLNNAIRAELKKEGALQEGRTFGVMSKENRKMEREFAPGDKIIFLKNDTRAGVENGTLGTIEAMTDRRMTVVIDQKTGETVTIDTAKYKHIDHAYAITNHKAQGISEMNVLGNIDSGLAVMNNRNMFYVIASRHKEKFVLYADDKAKITEQVQEFARKLTSRDFAPQQEREVVAVPEQEQARTGEEAQQREAAEQQAAQERSAAAEVREKEELKEIAEINAAQIQRQEAAEREAALSAEQAIPEKAPDGPGIEKDDSRPELDQMREGERGGRGKAPEIREEGRFGSALPVSETLDHRDALERRSGSLDDELNAYRSGSRFRDSEKMKDRGSGKVGHAPLEKPDGKAAEINPDFGKGPVKGKEEGRAAAVAREDSAARGSESFNVPTLRDMMMGQGPAKQEIPHVVGENIDEARDKIKAAAREFANQAPAEPKPHEVSKAEALTTIDKRLAEYTIIQERRAQIMAREVAAAQEKINKEWADRSGPDYKAFIKSESERIKGQRAELEKDKEAHARNKPGLFAGSERKEQYKADTLSLQRREELQQKQEARHELHRRSGVEAQKAALPPVVFERERIAKERARRDSPDMQRAEQESRTVAEKETRLRRVKNELVRVKSSRVKGVDLSGDGIRAIEACDKKSLEVAGSIREQVHQEQARSREQNKTLDKGRER